MSGLPMILLLRCGSHSLIGRIDTRPLEYMSTRPPFDDDSLRLEFLTRLNAAQGVDLSPAKIALRPGIPLAVLADDQTRGKVKALAWFLGQAHPPRQGEGVLPE